MKYEIQNIDQLDILREYLSPEIMKQAEELGGIVGIARDDAGDTVTGIVVCIIDDSVINGAKLSYLYVAKDFRREHIATNMLDEVCKFLKKIEIKVLQCDIVGEIQGVVPWSAFLRSAGFEPLILNWHVLEYEPAVLIKNNKLEQIYNGDMDNLFSTVSAQEAAYLCRQSETLPFYLKSLIKSNADVSNSIFYLNGSNIMGCALVRTEQNGSLSLLDIYIDPRTKQPILLLYMLAYLFRTNGRLLKKINKVYVHVIDEKCRKLYFNVFGNPMSDYRVQRYEKILDLEE